MEPDSKSSGHNGLFPDSWIVGTAAAELARDDPLIRPQLAPDRALAELADRVEGLEQGAQRAESRARQLEHQLAELGVAQARLREARADRLDDLRLDLQRLTQTVATLTRRQRRRHRLLMVLLLVVIAAAGARLATELPDTAMAGPLRLDIERRLAELGQWVTGLVGGADRAAASDTVRP